MASLVVTLTEALTLNSDVYDNSNAITIASIEEVTKRVVNVTTTEIPIVAFGATAGQGSYIAGNVRYIRLTNLDATNHIFLVFKNEYNNECCMKLDKGQSFIYNPDLTSGVIDTMLANQIALGFAETTGDCATGSDDVLAITANGGIIPGLRVSNATSTIPADTSVGAVTGANAGVSAATSHTMVTRHATTGAETASNATGNEDNNQTYAAGFGDLVEITAEAAASTCKLEMFIASV